MKFLKISFAIAPKMLYTTSGTQTSVDEIHCSVPGTGDKDQIYVLLYHNIREVIAGSLIYSAITASPHGKPHLLAEGCPPTYVSGRWLDIIILGQMNLLAWFCHKQPMTPCLSLSSNFDLRSVWVGLLFACPGIFVSPRSIHPDHSGQSTCVSMQDNTVGTVTWNRQVPP